MMKRGIGVLLICLVATLLMSPVRCDDSSEEKKDEKDNSSSFGSILRNVGSSIQEGAKKVGETFQKGYEYVKKKVKEIGEDDDKSKESNESKESKDSQEKPAVVEPAKKPGSDATDGGKVDSTTADVDNRFLFDTPAKCPPGQALDHSNHCRPT